VSGGGDHSAATSLYDALRWILSVPAAGFKWAESWPNQAGAGTTGARYGDLDRVAWHYGFGKLSRPVATKEPNAWGLYDMLGNVAEWTADWLGPYRPNKSTDPRGPPTGQYRVLRGGNWDEQGPIRVSERDGTIFLRSWSIGFRCAGDLR
jgi:formylglycine-generating enzyme required for sulfatase activity